MIKNNTNEGFQKWYLHVPKHLDSMVRKAIGQKDSEFVSLSEFVRNAVRDKLKKMKINQEEVIQG